jgi:UvrD-like helicase C-terminal domain
VAYGFDELDELTHAYAVSIHRSQGSEYPCVVVPLTMSAWMMLQRNLLYTAVTRAKRIVVLVGSRRALAKAVRTQGAGRRYTALTDRLQQRRARTVVAVGQPWDGRLQQSRSSPRSGSAIGSDRQDGQGDARAVHQLGLHGVPDEG